MVFRSWRNRLKILYVASAVALGALANAQVWNEVGDAPDGVPAHQITMGSGALTTINGRINRPGGDHVDTYCFMITSQTSFFATTLNFYGGGATNQTGANEDTRLWLWTPNGQVLLGNDDVNALGGNTLGSLISDPTTFGAYSGGEVVNGTAAGVVLNPGMYLLSISEFSNDPVDAAGTPIVDLGSDFDALHGANPQAGPFASWENATDADDITYSIVLDGAAYCAPVPEPATCAALGLGLAALVARRRRKKAA